MSKFGKSQPVRRREDLRFLTGNGCYLDDAPPRGALFAWFFRSPVAHAKILSLRVAAARTMPGVHLVWTADDLEANGMRIGIEFEVVKNRDGTDGAAPLRPELARGRVRHVGEPVAMIVAESRQAAQDAAERIEFDFEPLEAAVDPALDGPQIHESAPRNRAFDWAVGADDAALDRAFAESTHVVRLKVSDNRVISSPMEGRGVWADWDGARLHFCFGGQGVWRMKDRLARKLGLAPRSVHVTIPDVGGGFGTKVFEYPEYAPIALAARTLRQPVRWVAERGEGMLSDNAGRDLVSRAELGFDAQNRITAYRVCSRANIGAYVSPHGQIIQTELFSKVLTGPYHIPIAGLQVEGVFTNTAPVDAYRGAGRPEANYVLERTMEEAARSLGVDIWELRKHNFIPANAFPYHTPTGETYDVGNFHAVLNRAENLCNRGGFAARKAASTARGKLRGIGLCYYIESILGNPTEGATITFENDGTVTLCVGTQSTGQGHETTFAAHLADLTGIPRDRIQVIQGDSDRIDEGGGTGGSRSVTTQGTATLATVDKMVGVFAGLVAENEDVPPRQVSFDGERFRVAGSNAVYSMLDAADLARRMNRQELLKHSAKATLPGRSYPNGAHVAEVEIDPETGLVRLVCYTVVDDFGNLLNPMLVEGQVHGGVAQGAGQALCEHVVHDAEGQLQTASFMDYAIPRADNLPMIAFHSHPVPSTANPLGVKGCGEAGTVGSMAAVANAVRDALAERGVTQADMPFTPFRVWAMLEHGRDSAAQE